MYKVKGARGIEVVPHYEFWKSLPLLIKVWLGLFSLTPPSLPPYLFLLPLLSRSFLPSSSLPPSPPPSLPPYLPPFLPPFLLPVLPRSSLTPPFLPPFLPHSSLPSSPSLLPLSLFLSCLPTFLPPSPVPPNYRRASCSQSLPASRSVVVAMKRSRNVDTFLPYNNYLSFPRVLFV